MSTPDDDLVDGELAAVVEYLRRRVAAEGTPVLPAAEDRMPQVRRRIRRARRIRVAALATPVLALAVAAATLLPGSPRNTGPAADVPAATTGPVSSPQPSPSADTTTRPLELHGWTISHLGKMPVAAVPVTWHVLRRPEPGHEGEYQGAYVTSVASGGEGAGPCHGPLSGNDTADCMPAVSLPKGGVLVFWAGVYREIIVPTGPQPVTPSSQCRAIGGTQAIEEYIPLPPVRGNFVRAYACLASPDQSLVNETTAVLSSTHLLDVPVSPTASGR
ncbi:hypothetical protein F7Q99_13580 [Streptomyces kaniharaensis]|uniref:Uncharacterized protein n=1 Tax=Streptomyces kaniharaensis TaxID=212423 RepID=A0A6N7KR89_9ACTN|nr:hypothetical protein [Streptomyces kaniharaensis]MQS13285.1 hypothetical protein [Streptomyces kaniharaensis]